MGLSFAFQLFGFEDGESVFEVVKGGSEGAL